MIDVTRYEGHTPGPLEANWKRKVGYYVRTAYDVPEHRAPLIVCRVREGLLAPSEKRTARANSRLFADAPDMLAEIVALRAERDALRAECDAWAGAVSEVVRHYPEEIWSPPKKGGTSCVDCYAAEGARIACRNVVRIMDEWRAERAALDGAKEGT